MPTAAHGRVAAIFAPASPGEVVRGHAHHERHLEAVRGARMALERAVDALEVAPLDVVAGEVGLAIAQLGGHALEPHKPTAALDAHERVAAISGPSALALGCGAAGGEVIPTGSIRVACVGW